MLQVDTSPPCVCSDDPAPRPHSWLLRSEDLLCAGGRDVQEPPGRIGVELALVSAESPHAQHSQYLVLQDRGRVRAKGRVRARHPLQDERRARRETLPDQGTGRDQGVVLRGLGSRAEAGTEAVTQDLVKLERSATLHQAQLKVLPCHAATPDSQLASLRVPAPSPPPLTHRVTLDHLAFGILDHHHQLGLEGDDQHRALLHHLAHGQLQGHDRAGRPENGPQPLRCRSPLQVQTPASAPQGCHLPLARFWAGTSQL